MIGNFWYAVATLVGTIVGVGIFGLPYIASQSGFFIVAAYLLVFCFVFVLLHLMYGEIILRNNERHRLVGYVKKYLGERARKIVTITTILGTLGGMFVYIIVGGKFLGVLFSGYLNVDFYGQSIFWLAGSALIIWGLKTIGRSEMIMLFFMGAVMALLFVGGINHIQVDNFFNFNFGRAFYPYGVVLFALAGMAAIPAVRDILERSEKKMKKAIILGTIIPVVFYILFVVLVVGVGGAGVSEDAMSGLRYVLGDFVVFIGALFGVLAAVTSYITFGLYLKGTFIYDLKVNKSLAALFVVLMPIFLTLIYSDGFIVVVGFLGAVFGGIESIFLIQTYKKVKRLGDRAPEYTLNISPIILNVLMVVFGAGIFYTLFFDGKM